MIFPVCSWTAKRWVVSYSYIPQSSIHNATLEVKAETEFDQYNNLPTTPIVNNNGNKITETGKKKNFFFHRNHIPSFFLLGSLEKPEAFTLGHTSWMHWDSIFARIKFQFELCHSIKFYLFLSLLRHRLEIESYTLCFAMRWCIWEGQSMRTVYKDFSIRTLEITWTLPTLNGKRPLKPAYQ